MKFRGIEIAIPNEWIEVSLTDLCNPKQWKTISTAELTGSGYVVYGANGKIGFYDTYTHDQPTVMITCRGATCGNIHISEPFSYINGNAMALDDISEDKIFLRYFYHSVRARGFDDAISGSAQPQITRQGLAPVSIALPPLAEQKQIAAKLDELLAQVDTIKARLDAIPKILKRFRQSVLAAAVSGRLTEEWRSANTLQAISLDDLTRSASLPKLKKNIKAPTVVEKPTEIEAPNVSWVATRLNTIARIDHGYAFKSENFSDVGPLVITPGNFLEDGGLDFINKRAVRHNESYPKEWALSNGDLLIVMTDLSIKKLILGKAIILNESELVLHNQRIGKVVPFSNRVKNEYICLLLNSPLVKKNIDETSSGTLIQHTSPSKILDISVAIPPTEEQTEIVRRVEQLFAFADQIEQRVKDATARVNHLTQSILAKAFRGELTADWRAQNPKLISGENSAEALLERIRAERATTNKPKKTVATRRARAGSNA